MGPVSGSVGQKVLRCNFKLQVKHTKINLLPDKVLLLLFSAHGVAVLPPLNWWLLFLFENWVLLTKTSYYSFVYGKISIKFASINILDKTFQNNSA